MHEWHSQAIARLRKQFEADPRYLALIVVGSVARGDAREDSDVDFVLVATDDEYARRHASRDLFSTGNEFSKDPSHQVGGYILDWQYLLDAAERGMNRHDFNSGKLISFFLTSRSWNRPSPA